MSKFLTGGIIQAPTNADNVVIKVTPNEVDCLLDIKYYLTYLLEIPKYKPAKHEINNILTILNAYITRPSLEKEKLERLMARADKLRALYDA
jgi:hypothetical protein